MQEQKTLSNELKNINILRKLLLFDETEAPGSQYLIKETEYMYKSHFKMRSDPIYTNQTVVTVNRGQEVLGYRLIQWKFHQNETK